MNNGLNFDVKRAIRLSGMLMKNGLNFDVKKN